MIKWWVDASNAVHPNMRSHTGATMTLGKGSPYSISSKQKINTVSSTEAELVGISDVMKLIICDDMWTSTRLRYRFQVQLAFKTMTELSKQYLNSKISTQRRTCYNVV